MTKKSFTVTIVETSLAILLATSRFGDKTSFKMQVFFQLHLVSKERKNMIEAKKNWV